MNEFFIQLNMIREHSHTRIDVTMKYVNNRHQIFIDEDRIQLPYRKENSNCQWLFWKYSIENYTRHFRWAVVILSISVLRVKRLFALVKNRL